MEKIYHNGDRACATCKFWNGSRRLTNDAKELLVPTGEGKCKIKEFETKDLEICESYKKFGRLV